jgi:hypothetical protein
MKRTLAACAIAVSALALSGCANSGFSKATQANTDRGNTYRGDLLLQAENNLNAINSCYIRASGYGAVNGADNLLVKVTEPSSPESCTVLATALNTQMNMAMMFSPYISRELMSRVPAAPEEIVENLLKFGIKASLTKFGIERVSDVITSGQAANAQIAAQGIEAASKPPLVVEKPFIVQVPLGSSPLPAAPVAP